MQKTLIGLIVAILIAGGAYMYFKPAMPSIDKIAGTTDTVATTGEFNSTAGVIYTVTPASTIGWTGSKVGGQHHGTINVSTGSITIVDGGIAGGSFALDMRSMVSSDLSGEDNKTLISHLSSTGFFDTATHPTALFTLISSTPNTASGSTMYTIVGDLALKGISKQITFPATVTVSGGNITTNASFFIDRTNRGIVEAKGMVSEFIGINFNLTFVK